MYAKALALPDFAPADVTALFSSAPAFVFLLSFIILKEKVTALKLLAVPMTVAGVVLFQYADGFSTVTLVGSMLSVGAAIGAATYKTMFKRCVGDAPLGQVALFLTTLGLLNAVFLWIIFVSLSATGDEPLTKSIPWKFLFASAILSLMFNFLINFGIAYTYPLFISLGTVVGIPLNAVVDRLFRDITFGVVKTEGSVFIIVGFLMLLLPNGVSDAIDEGFRVMFCREKCWSIGKAFRRPGSETSMTRLVDDDELECESESDVFDYGQSDS
jgi:solute carrier family 35 protein F3/4